MMQPSDWIAVVAGCLTIFSLIIAGNVWLIRSVVRQELTKFEERLNGKLP